MSKIICYARKQRSPNVKVLLIIFNCWRERLLKYWNIENAYSELKFFFQAMYLNDDLECSIREGIKKSQHSSQSSFTVTLWTSVQKAEHIKETPDSYNTNHAVWASLLSVTQTGRKILSVLPVQYSKRLVLIFPLSLKSTEISCFCSGDASRGGDPTSLKMPLPAEIIPLQSR